MLAAPKRLGSIRVPARRLPKRLAEHSFRPDAGNCTRGGCAQTYPVASQ